MTRRKQEPRGKRIEGMAPEILDVEGAAKLLGVSKRTVYKLAADKAIPAVKVGKEWRFSRKGLIEWVAGSAEKSEPQTLEELLKNGTYHHDEGKPPNKDSLSGTCARFLRRNLHAIR